MDGADLTLMSPHDRDAGGSLDYQDIPVPNVYRSVGRDLRAEIRRGYQRREHEGRKLIQVNGRPRRSQAIKTGPICWRLTLAKT